MPIPRRFVHFPLILSLIVILAISFWPKSQPALELNGQKIIVERAQSETDRQRGLSGRSSLEDNRGMLFIFASDEPHGIWMKDMLMNIDVLWLDSAGRIIHVEDNLAPSTYPTVFRPYGNARYVLELNEIAIERLHIKTGDLVVGLE